MRVSNARFNCLTGFLGGSLLAFTWSTQRLMGLDPNEEEVKKYGSLTPAQLERFQKWSENANINLIDSTNPLDEPKEPAKRYGNLTADEVVEYRKRAKTTPHVFKGEEEQK